MSPLLAFAGVAAVLTLAPGPDSLLVLRTAVSGGRAGAIAAAAGVCTALAGWGCATALGVTALLTAAPLLYLALRWAGAAYLAFLGVSLLLGHGSQLAEPEGSGPRPGATGHPPAVVRPPGAGHRRSCYARGAVTNAVNPKIGAFYLSLLPQFIPAGRPVLGYGLLLAGIHVAESLAWLAVVALLGGRLGHALRQRRAWRWADRVAGVAFLAFAARLAGQR